MNQVACIPAGSDHRMKPLTTPARRRFWIKFQTLYCEKCGKYVPIDELIKQTKQNLREMS